MPKIGVWNKRGWGVHDNKYFMDTGIVHRPNCKDKYFLVRTQYNKGDTFEIGKSFIGKTIARYRKNTEILPGMFSTAFYYEPSLFWSIPRDLHKYDLTIVGVVSELPEFQAIIQAPSEGDILVIKIN